MGYVRRTISEHLTEETVIRRYEVETPDWYARSWAFDVQFPKLVTLELRLSRECADYFAKTPLSLAEAVWDMGLQTACFKPFCCCEYPVLYYPREPRVKPISALQRHHFGPVILSVVLGPP